ncbi:hypothetical protein JZ751_026008 [Albula glossodonta]|uniref:PH domain-containing protein n=1 Tax=Albula glossodonta TaxID=121402 RepID=A0A8T2MRR4_9TELE|nr:hypothetical protein JZ751_026008 [Albula glossodonta]
MSEPQPDQRPSSMVSESSTAVTSSTVDTTSGSKGSRSSGKVHSFGKRDQAIKRNLNVPVVVRGWLYKQETVLGSIPLPSYVITPVEPEDHISRKYAFKAEHGGMRTYFFSADTQEDMNGWVRAMNQAAMMQGPGPTRELETSEKSLEAEISERQAGPQTNHINDCGISPSQPEGVAGLEAEPELVGAELNVESGVELVAEEEPCAPRRPTPEVQVETRPPAGAGGQDALSPDSAPPSRAPSTLPAPTPTPAPGPAHRNGLPPEQNGTAGPRRGLVPLTSRSDAERQVQRKTALAQVEHWVKVQKGDSKSLPSAEGTLPRRTPPPQHKVGALEAYQSLPKTSRHPSGGSSPPRNLPSDYKYAHDRLSHFRMSMGEREASREGTVWRLYEWQQRQQYRHGSPTAPIFGDYTDSAPFRVALEVPRSISVPPSPSDIPPPGPPSKALSPRRPHTPADRVTVRPADDPPAVESSHIERRSMPPIGYITHTVSAPSLHGKTPEELTLLLIQLRRHQARMASVRNDALNHLQQHNGPSGLRFQLKKDLEYLDLKVGFDSTSNPLPLPLSSLPLPPGLLRLPHPSLPFMLIPTVTCRDVSCRDALSSPITVAPGLVSVLGVIPSRCPSVYRSDSSRCCHGESGLALAKGTERAQSELGRPWKRVPCKSHSRVLFQKHSRVLFHLIYSCGFSQDYVASMLVTGRETLKDRSMKPLKIAESDVDLGFYFQTHLTHFLQKKEKISASSNNMRL